MIIRISRAIHSFFINYIYIGTTYYKLIYFIVLKQYKMNKLWSKIQRRNGRNLSPILRRDRLMLYPTTSTPWIIIWVQCSCASFCLVCFLWIINMRVFSVVCVNEHFKEIHLVIKHLVVVTCRYDESISIRYFMFNKYFCYWNYLV